MLSRKWKTRAVSVLFVFAAGFVLYKVGRSLVVVPSVIHKNEHTDISGKNEFSGVIYTSFDKDSNKFTLKSSKITENDEKSLDFNSMVTTFKISQEETATVFADQTHLISEGSRQCKMKGNVKLSTEEGLLLETDESFIDIDDKIARGDTDIIITQDDTKFSAKKYKFDMNKKIMTLINNVKGNLASDRIFADKLIIEFEKAIGKDFKKVHAFGNSCYKTDQYDIKANKEIIYKKGYAEASSKVDLNFEQNKKQYHVNAENLAMHLKNNAIKKVTADGDIIIKVDNSIIIKGNHGILENDLLTVSGDTIIRNEEGKILCKKAILNTKTNVIKVYDSRGIIKRN